VFSNIGKGERGLGYQQNGCYLKLRKDANGNHSFCSSVSTLLSMIASAKGIGDSEKRVRKGDYHAERRELYTLYSTVESVYPILVPALGIQI